MLGLVSLDSSIMGKRNGLLCKSDRAENRPVRWESGDTVVTINFECMGRRTFVKVEYYVIK
jgi:hypothetical protein